MGAKEWNKYIRNDEDQRLIHQIEPLIQAFAERAPLYDESGAFPFENIADLHQAGYLSLTVPEQFGGRGISLYQLILLQERIAYGDGSTALAVGWHMGIMHQLGLTRHWPGALFQDFCRKVVDDGEMINSFVTEPNTGSPTRGGAMETYAEKTEGGWLLTGRKTYSTLSPVLNHFVILAHIRGGDQQNGEFFVSKRDGVRIEETWNTMGMRATGSHDVILDKVFVPDAEVIAITTRGVQQARKDDGSGWMLHIPACYIGIAFAARDFAVRYAQSYKPSSLPGPIAELATIQQQIGLIEVELRTARTMLYASAQRYDDEPNNRPLLKTEFGLVKYVCTNHALRVLDLAMRIVGGASLSRKLPLERMYRDVRAGLHNPPMDDVVLRNLAKQALDELTQS